MDANNKDNYRYRNYISYLRNARPPHKFWGETDSPQSLQKLETGPGFDSRSRALTKEDFDMSKVIQMFSIPRSGSTLVRQIISEIFDYNRFIYYYKVPRFNIFNTKEEKNLASPVLMTYRDFRDVLLSTRRMRLSMSGIAAQEGYMLMPSKEEIDLLLEREILPQIEGLRYIREREKENVLLLKYEEFCNNYDYIFDKLESFFSNSKYHKILKSHGYDTNFKIAGDLRERIKAEYSLVKNRKISDCSGRFKNWDKSKPSGLAIHGDHITNGEVKEWKRIPASISDYMTERLLEHLKEWGYE